MWDSNPRLAHLFQRDYTCFELVYKFCVCCTVYNYSVPKSVINSAYSAYAAKQ